MSKQEEIKQALALLHKGGAVPLNVVEAVNDLLEQAEQQPELWECPGCGFTYDACHEDIDPATGEGNGNHTCPECELIDVERERDRLRKELALKDATIADLNHNRGLLSKEIEEVRKELSNPRPRPLEEWGEDYGDVLWWKFPIEEPPYCGNPLDSEWLDDYYTHWTPIVTPDLGQEGEGNQ